MKPKLNFRSVVFKRAYLIVKQSGINFSEALKAAWTRYREFKNRIVNELATRIDNFDFYYYMSDDMRVIREWSAIEKEISDQVKTFPYSFIAAIAGQLRNSNNIAKFI